MLKHGLNLEALPVMGLQKRLAAGSSTSHRQGPSGGGRRDRLHYNEGFQHQMDLEFSILLWHFYRLLQLRLLSEAIHFHEPQLYRAKYHCLTQTFGEVRLQL